MSDSDPHHIRASNFVQQWNQDIADAAARQRTYEAYNGISSWRGVGSADAPRLSAWVFAAGILGFAVGMLLGDGEFLPMVGYGLLSGAVCAGAALVVRKAVGFILRMLRKVLGGARDAIGGLFGKSRDTAVSSTTSTAAAMARAVFLGGVIGALVGAGIAIALQDSVIDAALRVAVIGAGIGLFFGIVSMVRR